MDEDEDYSVAEEDLRMQVLMAGGGGTAKPSSTHTDSAGFLLSLVCYCWVHNEGRVADGSAYWGSLRALI